jgi:hypothetical protein
LEKNSAKDTTHTKREARISSTALGGFRCASRASAAKAGVRETRDKEAGYNVFILRMYVFYNINKKKARCDAIWLQMDDERKGGSERKPSEGSGAAESGKTCSSGERSVRPRRWSLRDGRQQVAARFPSLCSLLQALLLDDDDDGSGEQLQGRGAKEERDTCASRAPNTSGPCTWRKQAQEDKEHPFENQPTASSPAS